MVTPMALKLIRRFDGDVIGDKAIICNCSREEPSKDKNGRIVDGAFRIFFPNNQAICYTLSGEISFVLYSASIITWGRRRRPRRFCSVSSFFALRRQGKNT